MGYSHVCLDIDDPIALGGRSFELSVAITGSLHHLSSDAVVVVVVVV
jgi:hypothetical protein